MNQTGRIILCVLCGLLIAAAPFLISSPALLSEVKWELMEQVEDEEGEELDLGRLLFASAMAEDALAEEIVEDDALIEEDIAEGDSDLISGLYELPLDFSVPPAPRAENFTETSYEDATIRVTIEERVEENAIWELAFVQIASPTQLRTATKYSHEISEMYGDASVEELEKAINKKIATTNGTDYVSSIAKRNHAVVAINGDNYVDNAKFTSNEYRMTYKIRSKTNQTKDMLFIDENGDFHIVLAQKSDDQAAELKGLAEEHTTVNLLTFGPALVIDGVEHETDKNYKYNPNGHQPRSAIGQIGHLSYVLVIARGKDGSDSSGVTHQELAHFMAQIGCKQAYNLDGGNSAEMYFNDQIIRGTSGKQRALSDIIYFATALSED